MLIKYIFACIRVKNKFFCKILSTLVRICRFEDTFEDIFFSLQEQVDFTVLVEDVNNYKK